MMVGATEPPGSLDNLNQASRVNLVIVGKAARDAYLPEPRVKLPPFEVEYVGEPVNVKLFPSPLRSDQVVPDPE